MIRTGLSRKISEVENKIPDTGSLVTTIIFKTKTREVANKILDNAKCITTLEFNKLIAENFAARLTLPDAGIFELQKHSSDVQIWSVVSASVAEFMKVFRTVNRPRPLKLWHHNLPYTVIFAYLGVINTS